MNKISYCLLAISAIFSVSVAVADSAMSIIISCQPHTNEQFAARELKYHIEKATGNKDRFNFCSSGAEVKH